MNRRTLLALFCGLLFAVWLVVAIGSSVSVQHPTAPTRSRARPMHTILITVYNQAPIIYQVVLAAAELAREPFELIVVVDGCTDRSRDEVDRALAAINNPEMMDKRIIVLPTSVFETAANNVGLRAVKGMFVTLIQDDMQMTLEGYNAVLTKQLLGYDDLVAVSGRCGHAFDETRMVGRCGVLVDRPLAPTKGPCKLYLRPTANRGPLTIRMDRMRALGYFDQDHFVLDDSDHDFAARAWGTKGWRVGVLPIPFHAPLAWGKTRQPRSADQQAILDSFKGREADSYLAKFKTRPGLWPKDQERSCVL